MDILIPFTYKVADCNSTGICKVLSGRGPVEVLYKCLDEGRREMRDLAGERDGGGEGMSILCAH